MIDGAEAMIDGAIGGAGRAMVDEQLLRYVLGDRVSRYDMAAELQPRASRMPELPQKQGTGHETVR